MSEESVDKAAIMTGARAVVEFRDPHTGKTTTLIEMSADPIAERPTKQVIVMRKDLNMRKGKMVAQGAHASLTALMNSAYLNPEDSGWCEYEPIRLWMADSFTKICVSVNSEEGLVAIYEKVRERYKDLALPFPAALITDAGRTEFNGVPTKTCCAIGPWWADEIDEITGKLPLL